MENNFEKYLKYKKKYLDLKSIVGGNNKKDYFSIINPKFCDNGLPGSIYIPELCGSEFPCLNKNKVCFSDKKITNRNRGLDIPKINSFFYNNKFKKLLLNSEKKEKKENNNLISNLQPLGSGGINSVFQLYKFDEESNDITPIEEKVLKLENLNDRENIINYETNIKINKEFEIYIEGKDIDDNNLTKIKEQFFNNNYQKIRLKVTNKIDEKYKKQRESFIENSRIIEELLKENDIEKYVCKIYDYGYFDILSDSKTEKNAGVYSIIEKLDGGELFDRLQNFDYLKNIEVFKKLMLNILSGLSKIHKKGFLHMDIKIENIMMVYPIPKEYTKELNEELVNSTIKFIDFDTITKIGSPINENKRFGTPQNMSPVLIQQMNSPVSPDNDTFDIQHDLHQVGILMIIVLLRQNANSKYEYLQILRYNKNLIPPKLYEIIEILINDEIVRPPIEEIIEYLDNKRFIPIPEEKETSKKETTTNPPLKVNRIESDQEEEDEDSELSEINNSI